jgi:hypothetical protein
MAILVCSPIFPYSPNGLFWKIKITDQILTLKEVSASLKITEKTANRLAAEMKLSALKLVV